MNPVEEIEVINNANEPLGIFVAFPKIWQASLVAWNVSLINRYYFIECNAILFPSVSMKCAINPFAQSKFLAL